MSAPLSAPPKLLVIGIDGGSYDTIDPLIEAGRLPHLAGLIGSSASSRTTTTWPAHTAPGWSTFVSASQPGGHGIYQFFDTQEPGYGARTTQAADLGRSSVWDWMAAQGWTLGLVNIPMSHPPADLPGYQISWPLEQTLHHCHPKDVLRDLARAGAHFQSDLATMYRGDLAYLDQAEENVEARLRSVEHLMTTRPTDAVMVVLTEADRVGHHYWHFTDPDHPLYDPEGIEHGWDRALTRIYTAMDAAVGRLLDMVDDETTVVLVSDHGLGLGRYNLAVHPVLEEAGLLTTVAADGPEPGTASWFAHGGRRVDFRKSRVYLPVPGSNGVNVNLRGRQTRGPVAPRDREKVLAEAAEVLGSLTTPDGGRVFRAVLPREEVYPGPFTGRAPDLVLLPEDETVLPVPALTGGVWQPSTQTGLHRHQGIWAHRSPRVTPGRRDGTVALADVAPTFLADLGLAWPDDVRGRPVAEIFPAGVSAPAAADLRELVPAGAPADPPASNPGEDEYTSSALKAMGYL